MNIFYSEVLEVGCRGKPGTCQVAPANKYCFSFVPLGTDLVQVFDLPAGGRLFVFCLEMLGVAPFAIGNLFAD